MICVRGLNCHFTDSGRDAPEWYPDHGYFVFGSESCDHRGKQDKPRKSNWGKSVRAGPVATSAAWDVEWPFEGPESPPDLPATGGLKTTAFGAG